MNIYYSPRHQLHHPELEFFEGEMRHYYDVPQRAEIILRGLADKSAGDVLPPVDAGIAPIVAVHDAQYVAYLQNAYEAWVNAGGLRAGVYPDTFPVRQMSHRPNSPVALAGYYNMDLTAVITAGTWDAAYSSAQCAISAAMHVAAGASAAFALCRPPGHHAAADASGGYCFLNNAAIAASFLGQHAGANRVALLDLDFHHGNGSQAIFYNRSDVLFVSIHADPDRQYPYFTGTAEERGVGDGYGYNVNYPLEYGITDAQYLDVLAQACIDINSYAPDFLVISLGVDTYAGDPLGDSNLTQQVYERIGQQLAQLKLATVFIMEGGYAIEQLGQNVASVLVGFESNQA